MRGKGLAAAHAGGSCDVKHEGRAGRTRRRRRATDRGRHGARDLWWSAVARARTQADGAEAAARQAAVRFFRRAIRLLATTPGGSPEGLYQT